MDKITYFYQVVAYNSAIYEGKRICIIFTLRY